MINKTYRDSLLSALCVISWCVIVFRIFNAVSDASAIREFIMTWFITITAGIIGGIVLLLIGTLKKRNLRFSFIYNLFGTLNIIVGFFGMMLPQVEGRPSPYMITASLVVGLAMYKTIYSSKRKINFS